MFRKIYKESKKSKMNVIGYIDVNGVPIPKITKTKPNKKPQKLTKSTYLIF